MKKGHVVLPVEEYNKLLEEVHQIKFGIEIRTNEYNNTLSLIIKPSLAVKIAAEKMKDVRNSENYDMYDEYDMYISDITIAKLKKPAASNEEEGAE